MSTTYLWLHNVKKFLKATTATTSTKFGRIDTCSQDAMIRGRPCTSKGLETWDGWLISSNTHCFFLFSYKID